MEKVVVDASIVVKWFIDEPGSKEALELRDRCVDGGLELVAPSLLHYEVLNALNYKGLYTFPELCEISSAIDSYSFILRQLSGDTSKAALRIASESSITVYDAAYAATALLEKATLYTADRRLATKLSSRGDISVACISK